MTLLIVFIVATLLVSHTGIAWAGILTTPGNLFDWVPAKLQRIKNEYVQDLLSCSKCISGQFAFWTFIGLSVYYDRFHWFFSAFVLIAWVSWVIVVTDQLFKRYGYS